jgi:hypothetical protein
MQRRGPVGRRRDRHGRQTLHPSGLSRARGILLVLLVLLVLLPVRANAQRTVLAMSTSTVTFATPTIADFNTGYLCAGMVTFSGTADNTTHSDTLFVRAGTPLTTLTSTVAGETKLLSDYQFNIDPAGCAATSTWTSIPSQLSAPAMVYVTGPYRNQTLAGPVYFRLLVTWASDLGGATYTLPALRWFVNRPLTIPPPP